MTRVKMWQVSSAHQGRAFLCTKPHCCAHLVLPHPLWMPFWRGSVVLAFFAALLLLYIMAGGSGGHQTTLNEIGSVRLLAPQHEATRARAHRPVPRRAHSLV